MIKFAVKVVLLAVVFYFVAKYVNGIHVEQNPNNVLGLSVTFIWLALLFAVVNAILRPVFKLLSLPFIIVTLGLFLLLINALMLKFAAWIADQADVAFRVEGFWNAVGGALVISLVLMALEASFGDDQRRRKREHYKGEPYR